MIALQIQEVKQFMAKLLTSECFDFFLVEEATIQTYNTFHIDGHQNKEYYTSEELSDTFVCPYEFSTWKTLKNLCYDLIKGKKAPTYFKFVFLLIPAQLPQLHVEQVLTSDTSQIKTFVLSIKYDGTGLTLTTGTAFHTFLLDKSPDFFWDKAIRQFLTNNAIAYVEL